MASNVSTAAAVTIVAPQSPSETASEKGSISSPSATSVTFRNPILETSQKTCAGTRSTGEKATPSIPETSTNERATELQIPSRTRDLSGGVKLLSDNVSVLGSSVVEVLPVKLSTFGLPPIVQKRKFSFPAALHANLLGLSGNNESSITTPISARRRFSNVGDVVSRKLSNTIGWRTLPVPPQEVVAQGKALCCQYIRNRLKRSGIFNKKLGLYRLRSVVGTPSGIIVTEVYPSLVTAGQELERMFPKVYSSVARQASSTPAGVIVSDKAAAALLLAIGRELIKTDVTWGKVVAIFAVAGGLAVDCVCQGHPEYLHGLVEGVTDLLEEELAEWIACNGGWTSLSAQCRCPIPETTTSAYLSILGIFMLIIFVFFIIVRFLFRLYSF